MPVFSVVGTLIDLPAIPVFPKASTRDNGAWLHGQYVTVKLTAPVEGIRVHTDGRHFPGRPASGGAGAWVALGDVIGTSTELVSNRSLPGVFTRVSEALLPSFCVTNVGVCSALFGGAGGGVQAEYVSGPPVSFHQLHGKYWHGSAAHA
jgi:hypothetical protein